MMVAPALPFDRSLLNSKILDWADEVERSNAALRSELASYRQLPLIPLDEHQRIRAQLKQALETIDAMAGAMQEQEDKRVSRLAARLLQLWQDELRDADKEWHPSERRWRHNEVRAILIEQGRDVVGEGR